MWTAEEEGHLVDLQWHRCAAAPRPLASSCPHDPPDSKCLASHWPQRGGQQRPHGASHPPRPPRSRPRLAAPTASRFSPHSQGLFVAVSSAGTVALGFAASCTAVARLPRAASAPTRIVASTDCRAFSVAVGGGAGALRPITACVSFRAGPVLDVLPSVMFVTSACAAVRHYAAAMHSAFAEARQAVRRRLYPRRPRSPSSLLQLLAVRKMLRHVLDDAAESLKTHGEVGERVPGVPVRAAGTGAGVKQGMCPIASSRSAPRSHRPCRKRFWHWRGLAPCGRLCATFSPAHSRLTCWPAAPTPATLGSPQRRLR